MAQSKNLNCLKVIYLTDKKYKTEKVPFKIKLTILKQIMFRRSNIGT